MGLVAIIGASMKSVKLLSAAAQGKAPNLDSARPP